MNRSQGLLLESHDRVPPNWLSLPIVEPAYAATAPPCSRDICNTIYNPIDGNPQRLEIRLIEILSTDGGHGPMSCTLRSFSLSQAPEYRALSYCWNTGPASAFRKKILVNGFDFLIQSSLWDALNMLFSHGHTTIWADAICLNQQDENEKARQVPRMRLIYQQAVEVVVWLGNESNDSTELVDTLKGIAQCNEVKHIRSKLQESLPVEQDNDYYPLGNDIRDELLETCVLQHVKQQLERSVPDDVLARMVARKRETFTMQLDAFFERPYWRRTWIVQEVASARSLRVFCGSDEMDWEDMTFPLSLREDGIIKWASQVDVAVRNLIRIENLRYKVRNRIPIGYLTALEKSYGCEAGDMRDKFYALLGLCWDAEHLMPHVTYAEDTTLNRMAFDLMRQWTDSGNLDVICLQSHLEENDQSLPSWLPKWLTLGASSMSDRLVDHIENSCPALLLTTHGHSWAATKRSRSSPRFNNYNRTMILDGKIVDVIDGLSVACDYICEKESSQRRWQSNCPTPKNKAQIEQIRRDLYSIFTMYKKRESSPLADQTLAIDCLFSKHTKTTYQDGGFDYLNTWLEGIQDFMIFGRPFHQWLLNRPKYRNLVKIKLHNALARDAGYRIDLEEQKEAISLAFEGVFSDARRLMTTTSGRVGWAHPSARPGNVIALLKGCNLPVVLARSGVDFNGRPMYALVGDAYVQGIMQGEAWGAVCEDLDEILLR